MFSCYDEVIASGMEIFKKLVPFWITFFLCLSVQVITISRFPRHSLKFSIIPISIYIGGYILLCLANGIHLTYLKPQNTSLKNSINVLISWFIYETKDKEKITYLPVTKKIINNGFANVILIMGESTNSRFLSLYGYPHNSTPFLKSMKRSKGFAYAKGISSGTNTSVSIPLFFNVQRELQFLQKNNEKMTNLFCLAKEQQYKTILLTCHSQKRFFDCGFEFIDESAQMQYIDQIKTKENNYARKSPSEYNLITTLSNISLADKNFIVLHPFAVHSPYEPYHSLINHPKNFDIKDQLQLSYAKALLYFDEWIETLITYVKKEMPENTIVIFVSDHGETVNENGLCGHAFLDPIVSDIAIFAFGPDNHPFLEWMRSTPYISHYDLGLKIAELIGVKIINPNDDGKTRYIQMPSPGKVDYISWQMQDKLPHFTKEKVLH